MESARAESCDVNLVWRDGGAAGLSATVVRRSEESDWVSVGAASSDGAGHFTFSDTTVMPGVRYWYSLRVGECDLAGEGSVDTPGGLDIAFVRAEAVDGALRLTWSAASRRPFAATVYRRGLQIDDRYPVDETWHVIGAHPSDATGRQEFDDPHVVAQAVYDYRLGVAQCGGETITGLAFRAQPPCGVGVPTLAVEASPCDVRLQWAVRDSSRWRVATLYRRTADGPWTTRAVVISDAIGRSVREILSVTGRGPLANDQLRVAITGVRPNPTEQDLTVSFFLPDDGPATFEVLDLAGRRILSRDVGQLGPGNHVLDLTAGRVLPSGVYAIRLSHAGEVRTTRAVVVR